MVRATFARCEHGWILVLQSERGFVELHGITEEDLIRNLKQSIHDLETAYNVEVAEALTVCRRVGNA